MQKTDKFQFIAYDIRIVSRWCSTCSQSHSHVRKPFVNNMLHKCVPGFMCPLYKDAKMVLFFLELRLCAIHMTIPSCLGTTNFTLPKYRTLSSLFPIRLFSPNFHFSCPPHPQPSLANKKKVGWSWMSLHLAPFLPLPSFWLNSPGPFSGFLQVCSSGSCCNRSPYIRNTLEHAWSRTAPHNIASVH